MRWVSREFGDDGWEWGGVSDPEDEEVLLVGFCEVVVSEVELEEEVDGGLRAELDMDNDPIAVDGEDIVHKDGARSWY